MLLAARLEQSTRRQKTFLLAYKLFSDIHTPRENKNKLFYFGMIQNDQRVDSGEKYFRYFASAFLVFPVAESKLKHLEIFNCCYVNDATD